MPSKLLGLARSLSNSRHDYRLNPNGLKGKAENSMTAQQIAGNLCRFSGGYRGEQENGVAAGRLNEAPGLAVLTSVRDGFFWIGKVRVMLNMLRHWIV
jgi:hypothetical protein